MEAKKNESKLWIQMLRKENQTGQYGCKKGTKQLVKRLNKKEILHN